MKGNKLPWHGPPIQENKIIVLQEKAALATKQERKRGKNLSPRNRKASPVDMSTL
jgi:hypothetical protein